MYMTRIRPILKPVFAKTQTAAWRAAQTWYHGGRRNECEQYQRTLIETITGQLCLKTHMRINASSHVLKKCISPMRFKDGFDWTENFDGVLQHNDATIFVNLKFVCSAGGAQTRTLREVYHFIRAQANHISTLQSCNTYFVNILEGDACAVAQNKFKFALKPSCRATRKQIFVGDMAAFTVFWRNLVGG
jgi:hypothetical protein